MDSDEVFLSGLDVFGRVVEQVPTDGWDRPSPCEGWTARDVLGHIVGVLDIGASILSGEPPDMTPVDTPGDKVGTDPLARWEAAAARVRTTLVGADLEKVVDSPMGPRSIREGLSFPAMDLHLHAWDLGRAVGIDVEISPAVQEFTREAVAPVPAEMMRSPGVFGPELEAPQGSTSTQQFVAWTGRSVR